MTYLIVNLQMYILFKMLSLFFQKFAQNPPLDGVGKYTCFCLRVVGPTTVFPLRHASKANFAPTCDKIEEVASKTKLIFDELCVLLPLSLLNSTSFKLNQPPIVCRHNVCFKKGVKRLYCTSSCNKIRCDKWQEAVQHIDIKEK